MRKLIFLFTTIILLGFGFILIKQKFEKKLLDPAQNFYQIDAGDYLVASISGVTVLLPKVKDYSSLLKTLQTVVNGATMGRQIIEVDLRFDKPIVRYGS